MTELPSLTGRLNPTLATGDIEVMSQADLQSTLLAAAKKGNNEVVRTCLESGADPREHDRLGWTPLEHAAYRGYIEVIDVLDPAISRAHQREAHDETHLLPRLQALPEDKGARQSRGLDVLPEQEIYIIVKLGSFDPNDRQEWLQLASPPPPHSRLFLTLCTDDASVDKVKISLPANGDVISDSFIFRSADIKNASLALRLFGTTSDDRDSHEFGYGVAFVGTFLTAAGPDLENVARTHAVLLHDPQSHLCVARVNCHVQIVKPYAGVHPVPSALAPRWTFGSRIGGHRGLGQNKVAWKFLQMGENTIGSFEKAYDLGAAFVEMDVQVTKDLVPIIYHDFLVSETGINAPMHTLDYDQFMFLSKTQFPRKRAAIASDDLDLEQPHMEDFNARISHTLEYGMKCFKPNTRGAFIQDHFATLKEALLKVPIHVPFNLELKYPMLFECHYWQMQPIRMELNLFIDTILDTVYAYAGDRRILFSSFCPELCIALWGKQHRYPVFFLNDGRAPTDDLRASSLQQAVFFARQWGLPGIVMESTAFVKCPRLVEYVHGFGLQCATYGARNNDPQAVEIQHDAGVDGVIVDRVHLISKHCKHGQVSS